MRIVRAEVLRIFDSTFAITTALEIIAIFVAIMGVASTLLTLVIERRRELAVLRLVGADRRQVRKMIVIEAMVIGAWILPEVVIGFAWFAFLDYDNGTLNMILRGLGLPPGGAEAVVLNSEMGPRAQRGEIGDETLWAWVGERLALGDELPAFRSDLRPRDRVEGGPGGE